MKKKLRVLVKTASLDTGNGRLAVRYFELRTPRGGRRFSAEIVIGPGDRIILDDDTITNLETRAMRLAPATLYSRRLAQGATAA